METKKVLIGFAILYVTTGVAIGKLIHLVHFKIIDF